MGRLRRGSIDDVRVKVPRNPGAQRCAAELVGYLACLDANGGNDRQCGGAREALTACMGAASKTANAWRHKAPINFHLKQVCPASRPQCASRLRTIPLAVAHVWNPHMLSQFLRNVKR